MEVDETTSSWQDVERPVPSGSIPPDESPQYRDEEDTPGIEFLPVPHGAENVQSLGNNVVNVPAGLYNF